MPVPVEWAYDPIDVDVTAYVGDTYSWIGWMSGDDGLPVDLTGVTGAGALRREPGAELLAEPIVSFPDPTTGEIDVDYVVDVPPGTYRWEVRLTWPSGTRKVLLAGTFRVLRSVVA